MANLEGRCQRRPQDSVQKFLEPQSGWSKEILGEGPAGTDIIINRFHCQYRDHIIIRALGILGEVTPTLERAAKWRRNCWTSEYSRPFTEEGCLATTKRWHGSVEGEANDSKSKSLRQLI